MTPAFQKVFFEVNRLVGQASYRADRLFIDQPLGWQHNHAALKRALKSAYDALWYNGPNYPRLVLARDELKQVV